MRRLCALTAVLLVAALAGAAPARAQTCSADDFARAVDGAGAELRAFNAQNAPRLQARLRQLKELRGWSDAEFDERSIEVLHDARIAELDQQANDILSRIDQLGDTTQGAPDCGKLDDLKAASIELLATMRAKSVHTIGRIDALLSERPAAQAAAPAAADPAARPQARSTPPPTPPAKAAPARPAQPVRPAEASRPAEPPATSWSTITTSDQQASLQAGPADTSPLMPQADAGDDGYTIDEIREATRGFFGQVSTSLASVIEHAFRRGGRPTAYVLGTEGGGAFLAGLRYGEGTLYLRQGGSQRIFWHGPSIGYDVGAAGSRTMFLIYRLRSPEDLYRRFTGIDGSAYLVGGVGITFLTNGQVVMAPIRSGVGLRLGASIGYIRFTPRQTWNPF